MEDFSLYLIWSAVVAAGIAVALYVTYALQPRLSLLLPSARAALATSAGTVAVAADPAGGGFRAGHRPWADPQPWRPGHR